MNWLSGHEWFVSGVLVVILAALVLALIYGAMKLVGGHVREFVDLLSIERDENKRGEKTIGALNWKCVRVLFVFGVLAIVVNEFSELAEVITKYLDVDRAQALHKSVDIANLFFVLAFVIVISVLAAYGDSKKKQ